MKRRTTALICGLAVPLAITAQAGAQTKPRDLGGGGWLAPETIVAGTITGVSGSSFTADASIVGPCPVHSFNPQPVYQPGGWGFAGNHAFTPQWEHGAGPSFPPGGGTTTPITTPVTTPTPTTSTPAGATTPTPTVEPNSPTAVTINTDSNTRFVINGDYSATAANLATGQRFEAEIPGAPSEGLTQLLSSDAQAVAAVSPPSATGTGGSSAVSPYAFVGTVTATDTSSSPETVTVNVTQSLPAGLFSGSQTYTVGAQTLVFGGTLNSLVGGTLSDLAVGDTVAGGEVGPSGESAAEVEQSPLKLLIDFPATAPSSGSASSTPSVTSPAAITAAVRHERKMAFKYAKRLLKKKLLKDKRVAADKSASTHANAH